MEIVGLIISIVALAFSLFTYFRHDIKIKAQSALLNNYQIEKLRREESEQKKAILEANVIAERGGRRIIKIYNKGKAIARNAIITLPNNSIIGIIDNPSPIDIRPQNGIEIIVLFSGDPVKIELVYNWEDDSNEFNEDKQMIQLY